MPKVSPTVHNFTAGELSPRLYGRSDIAKYSNGAKTLENILIHQAGSASRRPGSKYVAEVENSLEKTRLITFEFSTTQAYILEFGDQYIRFYRNQGQIVYEILTIDAAPAGGDFAPGETLTGAVSLESCIVVSKTTSTVYAIKHRTGDFDDGEIIASNGKSRNCAPGYPIVTASTTPAELATSYLTAELFDLQFAQDADTMWIVHPNHKPQELTRTAHDDWAITDYAPVWVGGIPIGGFIAADDYPSCVAMFEQRIWFANTNNNPQGIWGSESGDFDVMTPGVNAKDPVMYEIASDKVNAIRWLKPGPKSLLLGTLGATFSLSSGSDALAITPTNVSVKRDTTYGAANILPETIGNFIYYVGRDLNHLRELGFSFDIEAQQALDMTILADHIAKAADPLDDDGFTQIAYQQSPVSRLWCVRNDGQLAVLTRQIDQEVIGWSRQVSGSDSRDSGKYESVAIIPTDAGDDEVWVIVNRYINGATARYVEYFMPERFDHQQDAFFVDSGLSLDSPKTITDILAKTIIDDMEYVSEAAAQAAYSSSDDANASFVENATENAEYALGDVADSERRLAQKLVLGSAQLITGIAQKAATAVGPPTGDVTCRIETNTGGNLPSGILADANATKAISLTVSAWNDFIFATPFILAAGTYWIVFQCDNQATNDRWFLRAFDPAPDETAANSIDGGASWNNLNVTFTFKAYTVSLQCYSENTIITQGSYSLRVAAKQTDSLNDTLTKLGLSVNLTGLDAIKLDVRASRTGSNFKIGFHDSGGVTTEHTVNIAAADTWQTETIDISGVINANKDDIDSIIVTILNADNDNAFYIDNIYSPSDYIIIKATDHGFVDNDEVKIVDVVGMTELNGRSFVVERLGALTFALLDDGGSYIDGATYTAYISGGEVRKKVLTVGNLTHLVGEEVAITADGAAVANKIVSAAGEVTLDVKASMVHIGLPYISDIMLLPYPEGSATGTAIGKTQRTYKMIIKFYESLSVQFGPDEDNLDTIEETVLFTGDRIRSFPGDWSRDSSILLRQDKPLPLNILSVTLISDVVDD